jgi:hypothetical protein
MIALALACAGMARMPSASADTLRCGPALIEPGDDAAYVLEKCGEPNLPPVTAGAVAPGLSDNPHSVAILRADRWRYHRGTGTFPAVLILGDDGRVEAIQFEKHRDK